MVTGRARAGEHERRAPLVIVSVGRSGSTLLHGLLARHESASWLSRVCDAAPERPGRQRRVVRAAAAPGVGVLIRRKWPPDECYAFWGHHYRGFAEPCRDLTAEDVTLRVRDRLHGYFDGLITRSRPAPLIKVTGWPRAGFLAAILEGARFVHLVRDGRDVASSLLTVPWWRGWYGPVGWRFGPLSPREEAEWHRHGRSFVALAGMQWRRVLEAMEAAAEEVGRERWLDVRYEDLCANPAGVVDDILRFAGWDASASITAALRRGAVRAPASRWRTDLTARQADALGGVLQPTLARWGYE